MLPARRASLVAIFVLTTVASLFAFAPSGEAGHTLGARDCWHGAPVMCRLTWQQNQLLPIRLIDQFSDQVAWWQPHAETARRNWTTAQGPQVLSWFPQTNDSWVYVSDAVTGEHNLTADAGGITFNCDINGSCTRFNVAVNIYWSDIYINRNTVTLPLAPAAVKMIFAHEIGHTLGLDHHEDNGRLMNPELTNPPITGPKNPGDIGRNPPCSAGNAERGIRCVYNWGSNYQKYILNTATPLGPTGANWSFDADDQNQDGTPDLFNIMRYNTGSGRTELHVLSGASNFQTWLLNTATPLGPSPTNEFSFVVADWNLGGKPDLIAVKMANTGSGVTEVHILSGESGYQQWILNTATPLGLTDPTNWAFSVGDWNRDGTPDLWAIKKQGTGTGTTEVHILSGASNFQTWLVNTGTALGTTTQFFAFDAADHNRDGVPDLVVIKMQGGSGKTEVHILSGTTFQAWLVQTATPQLQTDPTNWAFPVADWGLDGVPDLIILRRQGSGSGSTEVHILAG